MSFLLKLDRYNVQQQETWPGRGRHILLQCEEDSVILYGTVFGRIPSAFYKGHKSCTNDEVIRDADLARTDAGNEISLGDTDNGIDIFEKCSTEAHSKMQRTVTTCSGKDESEKEKPVANCNVPAEKNKQRITDGPPIVPRARVELARNSDTARTRDMVEIGLDNHGVEWLHTNFVGKMYSCSWGKTPDSERIIAISVRREGFEEMLRTYADDTQNDRKSGEVLLEWNRDVSLSGIVLKRFVPNIGIRGEVLQKFYNEWVLGIKDMSGYIEHQKRFIKSGNLNLVWTPKEIDYIPESSNISSALGLANEESDKVDDKEVAEDDDEEEIEQESIEFGSLSGTIAEVYAHENISEINRLSSQPREAILYLYGAFNPIHMGHVNALLESKRWLENTAKYHVCETRIAIGCDTNIKEKFSKSHDLCMKFEHRLKLCELACENYPWIKVSRVPVSSQPKYGEQLRREINKPDATLVLLMGSDRAIPTNRSLHATRRENKFILCIGRKGMNSSMRKSFEAAKKNDPNRSMEFFVVPTELNDISSTSIRRKLRKMIDGNGKIQSKISHDLQIVQEMIESSWITEQEGEYIFQNCDSLYLNT